MKESLYQRRLIATLEYLFPGCVVLKNDSSFVQGIPDLLVLYGDKWAMLEVKIDEDAHVQPNQMYYVEKLDSMSFAAFIWPENEQVVLHDLQLTFGFVR